MWRYVAICVKTLGPQLRPTLRCNLKGKPVTSDGFRSNWHRLMPNATAPGENNEPPALAQGVHTP